MRRLALTQEDNVAALVLDHDECDIIVAWLCNPVTVIVDGKETLHRDQDSVYLGVENIPLIIEWLEEVQAALTDHWPRIGRVGGQRWLRRGSKKEGGRQ